MTGVTGHYRLIDPFDGPDPMTDECELRQEPHAAQRSEVADLTFTALKSLVGLATLLVSLVAIILFAFLAGSAVFAWFVIPLVTSIALIAASNRILVMALLAGNLLVLVYAGMLLHGVLNYHGGR